MHLENILSTDKLSPWLHQVFWKIQFCKHCRWHQCCVICDRHSPKEMTWQMVKPCVQMIPHVTCWDCGRSCATWHQYFDVRFESNQHIKKHQSRGRPRGQHTQQDISHSNMPKFYELPQIHKKGYPLQTQYPAGVQSYVGWQKK